MIHEISQPIKYHNPLHLLLAAILDAILDFSARTNNGHCILADSKTSGYYKYFGI